MTENKINKDEKQAELEKYRDLVLATIDYYLDNLNMKFKTEDFNSEEHFKEMKAKTEEHFQKGRLSRLKQWFHGLTEMQLETGDLKFNTYLLEKTNYDVDIFKSYFQRTDEIIKKGKITTDNQFNDINKMIDQLCQIEPIDSEKIELLNGLLIEYEQRKSRKTKKPSA